MKKKSNKEIEENSSSTEKRLVEYTVIIGNHLHQRINRHIHLLKNLKKDSSKQQWIQEAIREKLEEEFSDEKLGDRFLHLKMDRNLWSEVQNRIESLKSFHTSMSKKQWIEEAIYEKLDKEEQLSKELLKNMLKDSSEIFSRS